MKSFHDINWKKVLKVLGIIALVIVGILIIWHLVLWIISLIASLISMIVTGFQWLMGIIIFGFLAKTFIFKGSSTTSSSSNKKKPYFMPEADDNIADAGKQVPNASDQIPDARDQIPHVYKTERDKRRWYNK